LGRAAQGTRSEETGLSRVDRHRWRVRGGVDCGVRDLGLGDREPACGLRLCVDARGRQSRYPRRGVWIWAACKEEGWCQEGCGVCSRLGVGGWVGGRLRPSV